MIFELVEFDNAHYASNILQTDNLLKWDSLGNTHNLIIRSDFGANIEFTDEDKFAIEKHGNDQILSGKEFRCADNRFFAFLPKEYVNNYVFTVSPAKYAVFCCEYNPVTDICTLYIPNEACSYQCDVSANVNVRIEKEPVKKRFFGKKSEREYYIVNIPNIPGYIDGGLHYTFEGCRYHYPITKTMLGKPVYIPAFQSRTPQIKSTYGNGYRIQIR